MSNDKKVVNWGVLGTAGIAKKHVIPAMKDAEGCNLYAIAGRNSEKVESFKNEFGFEKGYNSYEELLDDENIDAVYIPLPNDIHKEWAIKAAQKKKHILCEKPFTPSLKDAKEVIDICNENGVMIMEAFAYLHNDAIISVAKCINDNKIGKIKTIESTFLIPTPADSNIRMIKENFGGAVYDVGCYNISLILNFMQKKPSSVKAVAFNTEKGIDIMCSTIMEFDKGQYASSLCGMNICGRGDRFFIYGETGAIEAYIPYNADGKLHYTVKTDSGEERFDFDVRNNYTLEVEQFNRCILNGEKPHVTNEFTMLVADVIDEVLKEINY